MSETHSKHALQPHEQFIKDLKALLGESYGPRLIAYLLHQYGLFKPSYSSTGHTDFNEGQRAAALYLTQEISLHAPASIATIMESAVHK